MEACGPASQFQVRSGCRDPVDAKPIASKFPSTAGYRLLSRPDDSLVRNFCCCIGVGRDRCLLGCRSHLPVTGRDHAGWRTDLLECPRYGGKEGGRHVRGSRWLDEFHSGSTQGAGKAAQEPFLEPYLEIEETEAEKKPSLEIKPKDHPRLDRPNYKAGMGAMFSSPVSVVLFLLLYAANIYAALEIAVFRNYHPGLVCGIAAVFPVLGPAIFLCIPTRIQKSHEELAAESMAQHAPEEQQLSYTHPTQADEGAEAAAAPAQPQVTVYQKGQTTFNRRFFETKFAGFLRMVPGEAEKDKVIYIKSARGEHIGNRFSRIMPNEVHLQIQKGGATSDAIIPFTEIYEIQVRPKEA
jgi:hypothetical protein